MEIRAYSKDYLDDAMRHMGEAFDFALQTLACPLRDFEAMFVVSDVSKQISKGNPKYISGMNGCELARMILAESGVFTDAPDNINLDRSPEYWVGWALAFYQWHSSRMFSEILRLVSLEEMLDMYPLFHEMDLGKLQEEIEERIRKRESRTRLRQRRENCALTQALLAERAGVSIRQIQLFEQRRRDINKAQAETLLRLSRTLHCTVEDLMEFGS